MASLKFSISVDKIEPKKPNSIVCSSHLSERCSLSWFTGYVHTTGACIIHSYCELKHIRVSPLDTDIPDTSESSKVDSLSDNLNKDSVDENSVYQNLELYRDLQKGRVNIWKRFRGVKKLTEGTKMKPSYRKKGNKFEKEKKPELAYQGDRMKTSSDCEEVLDVDFSAFGPDLSMEQCNIILKQFERASDSKALKFFQWMRNNGKLKQNLTAYNLVLRVLGRQEAWNEAEKMIWEMTCDSHCKLNFQVFNTLIYACYKRGLVKVGAKWFHMMLESKVKPNIATFGMLMSLYQKGGNVEEAEFTFLQMRNLKVTCQSAYSAMITIYTRLGMYDKAERVIGLLKEEKVILNMENWLVLINAYSQQGKLHEAKMVLLSMAEAGFPPNIVAYNTMITGYGKVGSMTAAQRLFDNLQSVGLQPDETTYRSMIEGWSRVDNYKEAKWHYRELKLSGFKPNSSNFYSLINLQANHEDEEGAIRTLNDMIGVGCHYSSVLGILLQAYERAGRFDKVPSLLKGSFYEHILVNQTCCSVVLMAYVKHSLVDEAVKVLKEKHWKDPEFEEHMYHFLICTCKDQGHFENAVKIYTCMPKSDKINLHITCTMIDIYSIMNLLTEAENLYLNLKSLGISLDMISFSVIVRMYVKSGSLKDACSVLDTMDKQKNIIPDVFLFRDMLRIYQRCGMVDKLANLYYKILKSGVTWDQEMYNCVINCCARALPVDELSRLFDEMLEHGFTPNTITFNVMLDVYGKSGLFKKVRRVYWMAKKRGMTDVISYNTIIATYGQSKDFKNMVSTVQKMQFNGFSVSLEAYNCMLDAYGKNGQMEKFRNVLQRMKESNCASDHYTYNIMINIYGEQGWIEEIANVLMELKASGVGPDLCSYNTLIKAYGIAGMIEDAVALVKEMRKNGVEPDRVTYINLITALQKSDKFLEAAKWSLWMKQIGLWIK